MKVDLDWIVLCEQAIVDSRTNLVTLVNCVETVSAVGFPANHPRFAIAALFSCEPSDKETAIDFRVIRTGSDGNDETLAELVGTVAPGRSRTRVVINFAYVRLLQPELVRFRIDYRPPGKRWTRGRAATLSVEQVSPNDLVRRINPGAATREQD